MSTYSWKYTVKKCYCYIFTYCTTKITNGVILWHWAIFQDWMKNESVITHWNFDMNLILISWSFTTLYYDETLFQKTELNAAHILVSAIEYQISQNENNGDLTWNHYSYHTGMRMIQNKQININAEHKGKKITKSLFFVLS